jgi:magnesium chelatase family protein
MLDRIDIFVDVPRVEYEKLVQPPAGSTSEVVRDRVWEVRERQRSRFAGSGLACNAEMGPVEVWEHCRVEEAAEALLRTAMNQLSLSARGFHRVLKVARTIADLDRSDQILTAHLAEALQYRHRSLS